jgi:uncharacterized protein
MSGTDKPAAGTIMWTDLTVPNAGEVRDFYSKVVGWTANPVDMDGYHDFSMLPPSADQAVAGICHSRGMNADLPAQWLVYIIVDDVDRSAGECVALGGKLVAGPRDMGGGRFCVIQDPAGAVAALYAP